MQPPTLKYTPISSSSHEANNPSGDLKTAYQPNHSLLPVGKIDDFSKPHLINQCNKSISLRKYQSELIADIYQHWLAGILRILLQLPTGGGKTICFAAIARDFLRYGQILILAHREELITQAADKVGAICGCLVGIIKSGHDFNPDAQIQVASVQTLVNRLELPIQPVLIVIDEAHHATAASYRKILAKWPNAYQLGVTATPARLDGSGFEGLFDVLVCGPSVGDLIADGHLSPYKLFADPHPMSIKGVKLSRGDYSASGIAKANDPIELAGNLVSSYRRHCDGKRNIVFSINVDHSRAIAAQFNRAGIPAASLDGSSAPNERRDTLARFAAGELLVLNNCNLFTEGFDLPKLDAVQIARPTKSLSMWLQMVGRALRTAPGKEFATIIDHTKNWQILGLPDRPRIWSLEGVQTEVRQTRLTRERQVIEEPEPLVPVEIIESDVELEEITADPLSEWKATYAELLERMRSRGYQPGWMYHQLVRLKPPYPIWHEFAKLRGYKSGWAWHQYRKQQDRQDRGGVA